jgi:ABC-type Zn uptake system ZnuABC Zn-binding protein ZnuA
MDMDADDEGRRHGPEETYRNNLRTSTDELQALVAKAEAELAQLNRVR